MKLFISGLLVLMSFGASAQFTGATIQASGLTCSMCSNAINRSLRSLDFVESVTPNIKNSSFEVKFKSGSKADVDKMRQKVEDAGFSVAKFTADVEFNNMVVSNDAHVRVSNTSFHFLDTKGQTLNGVQTVRILDKGFVTAKEFKKNSKLTKMQCYQTGIAGSCCTGSQVQPGKRIYHVTLS